MTLYDALRVLAESHTQDDNHVGFVIVAGIPSPYTTQHSPEDYYNAWKVLREQLHMPTKPLR